MKHKFIPLILASMAVGALAACGPKAPAVEPMPDKYNLMQHWEKDTATDEVYTVTEKENSFEVSYDGANGNEWACVSRSFAYDTAKIARFTEYKKVVFVGKLQVTSGFENVMFKVQGSDGNQREVTFAFGSTEKTYEMPLNFVQDWSKVSKLVFFANRGVNVSGAGKMTFTQFYLSKDEVVDANNIDKNAPTVPQDYTLYNGGDKLDIMYRWGYNDQIATAEANGKFTFTWGGADHPKAEWKFVSALFKSGNTQIKDAGFKRAVFEFTGTSGKQATFKVEAQGVAGVNIDKTVNMTGEKQTIEIDAATVLANADATGFMLLIFPEGATANPTTAGQIELSAAYVDKTEVTPEVTPQQYNVYDGSNSMTVMTDWRDNDDGVTMVPANDNQYKITWNGKGKWENVKARVKAGETTPLKDSGIKRAVFTISGTAGRNIMVKTECHNTPTDNGFAPVESAYIPMTGEEQTIEIDITGSVNATYTEIWVLIFPDPNSLGDAENEGQIILKNCVFDKETAHPYVPPEKPRNVASYQEYFLEVTEYKCADIGMTVENHVSTFTYSALAPGWGNNIQYKAKLHSDISWANPGDYVHFHAIFTASADVKILVKPYDNESANHAYTLEAGVETAVDFDVQAAVVDFDKPTVLFINPGDATGAATGTLVAKDMMFARVGLSYYKTGDSYVRVNNYGVASQGNYTLGQDENHDLTLAWTKAETGYDAAEIFVSHSGKGWNHLSVKVTSDVACKMIFKFPAQEMRADLIVGDNELEFDFTAMNEVWGNIKLMAGIPEGPAALSGHLTFVNFQLSVAL